MADDLEANPSDSASSRGSHRRKSTGRRVGRVLLAVAAVGIMLAVAAGAWIRSKLVASLPALDGERALPGLVAPVSVVRDALGVPTLRGASRVDLARALGFVHAQDRFFQMDLFRRAAAGELSELFGPAALEQDRKMRMHRFRSVARRVAQSAPAGDRALMDAYAAGVNAGLSALGSKPFEYLVLRGAPAPWLAEDSILVVLAMFAKLHDTSGRRESSIGVMRDLLPPKLFDFLAPGGTEWDAPLLGGQFPPPPMPGPEVFNLRTAAVPSMPSPFRWSQNEEEAIESLGSNNWAVAASRTSGGRALVANDMHLGLSVPNTWYAATLIWPSADGTGSWISGVTLPGTPAVSVGSNRYVAWAFTNSLGDWNDLVLIEPDPTDASRYLAPGGSRAFDHAVEEIRVKGAANETLEITSTIWGPVIDQDHRGRSRSFHWMAHDPEAINSELQGLENARTVDEAVQVANRAGMPPQNFVCADATGRIGWTLTGRIPRRVGFDGRIPTSWADGTRRWDGWLRPHEYPRIIDPPSGRLWTANARVLDGPMLDLLGDGGYANGARAKQIRDALFALDRATPHDMMRIQLDDRAIFLARWREVLLQALNDKAIANHPRRREVKGYVQNWGGRASIDSVGYRAVRTFHSILERQVFGALTARCLAADPRFDFFYAARQREAPLWRLVTERPMNLLSARFKSWDEQILAAADAMLEALGADGAELGKRTWGERNRSRIQHPLSRAIPLFHRFLDMPSEPLPGDVQMPRVQAPDEGASERLVISPGNEESGLFHMPGGQSGHPLSPFYRSSHASWAHGEQSPFISGQVSHRLTLLPAKH